MKLPKFNQSGITHILAPLLFIAIFAAIGGYVLQKSKAATLATDSSEATTYTNGKIYYGNSTIDPNTKVLKILSPTPDDFNPLYSSMSFGGKRVAYFKDPLLEKLKIGTLRDDSITNAGAVDSIPSNTLSLEAPEWSPDGSKVAVLISTNTNNSKNEIWYAKADGTKSKVIPNVQTDPYDIVGWRPGSENLMYAIFTSSTTTKINNSKICTISFSGTNRSCHYTIGSAKLNATLATLALAPNGDKIALIARVYNSPYSLNIYTINADGNESTLKLLISLPSAMSVPDIVWSPDSKKIAYVLNAIESSTPGASGIYVINADGRNKTRITTKLAHIYPNSLFLGRISRK